MVYFNYKRINIRIFPVFAVALVLWIIDRLFGTQFFTMANGGMDMMWANLFWVWGHPEVYIVILPAFGIYSEIIATFSRRNLYGYKSMVASMIAITFFRSCMGSPFLHNGSRCIKTVSSLLQQWRLPFQQGLRFSTGCLHCEKVKLNLQLQCFGLGLYSDFLIGGVTGVMLAMASADYQYHNSMFLVAHFHYTLIPGVVFGIFAGIIYWWPKVFGFMLNEKLGKVHSGSLPSSST